MLKLAQKIAPYKAIFPQPLIVLILVTDGPGIISLGQIKSISYTYIHANPWIPVSIQ